MTIPPLRDLPLQAQLAETERWPLDRLRWHQLIQLSVVADHAWRTVPFHRERLSAIGYEPGVKLGPQEWQRLPLLTRRDIQDAGAALHATQVPPGHGAILEESTSGSTGMPVTVLGTVLDAYYAKAFNLRFHLWHRSEFTLKFSAIRKLKADQARYPDGAQGDAWGDGATFPFKTGPSSVLNVLSSVAEQAEWLKRQDAHYLMTNPSTLAALTDQMDAPTTLRRVITFAEAVSPDLRASVRERWGVDLVDIYSAQEVNTIAIQCPEHEHYHLMAESALIEILDEQGRECAPGQIGRVVISPLHNFAMPLLRYDIGDYAEVGAPCDCGRTLPVITRVMGRVRNMLVTPDRQRYWPFLGGRSMRTIAPIRQHQFVQTALDTLEARLVCERPLAEDERTALAAFVQKHLPCKFNVSIIEVNELPRQAGGKFEDFRSEVSTAN